jgi:tetrapyrrole methylase family protein/MazG family protein
VGWVAIAELGQSVETPSERTRARLREADRVLVTSVGGAAAEVLTGLGIAFESYADHGMTADAPADQVVETIRPMGEQGGVVLAIRGYPFMREGLVSCLLKRYGPIEILPASSPLEVLLLAFDVDVTADLDLLDAKALKEALPERGSHLVVTGIANVIAARTVARRLCDLYPRGHLGVVAAPGVDGGFELRLAPMETIAEEPVDWSNAALYVAPSQLEPPGGFDELVRIMAMLRAPDGCPWDLEQTHMSLRRHLVEEAYETTAAIENGDMTGLADELGDILLQVVFHAQIAAENGDFTIDDAVANIVTKLRRRHPHIFGDATADTPAEVMHRWDRIKREERAGSGILDGIAHTLPALTYAEKISRRAVSTGFEWETVEDVWEKVEEEIRELKATSPGSTEAADEVGDVLFTVVNVARKMGVDAEEALRQTCEKFISRFRAMEGMAAGEGRGLADMETDEMEALWRLAKRAESGGEPAGATDEGS